MEGRYLATHTTPSARPASDLPPKTRRTPAFCNSGGANTLDKRHNPTSAYARAVLRYARDKGFADMVEDWNDFKPSLAPCDIPDAIHDCPPIELPGPGADVNDVKRFVYRTLTFRGHWINHPAVPLAMSHTAAVCQIMQHWYSDGNALLKGPRDLAAFSCPFPGRGDAAGLSFVADALWRTIVHLGGPEYLPNKDRIDSGVGESGRGEMQTFSDMDRQLEDTCAVLLPADGRKESTERVSFFEGMVGALLGLSSGKVIRHNRSQSKATNGNTPGLSLWSRLKLKSSHKRIQSNGTFKYTRSASESVETALMLPLLPFDREDGSRMGSDDQSETAAEDQPGSLISTELP